MLRLQNVIHTEEGDSVLCVLKRALQSASKEQGLLIGLLCWCLWFRRNKWVWERNNMSTFGIKSLAVNMLTDWRKALEQGERRTGGVQVQQRQWSKPPAGWLKVNIDASCRQGNEWIGAGCVVRDEEGRFVRARTTVVRGRAYAREAEALSLKEALSWMKTWRHNKCIFESDSKVLIDAIRAGQGKSIFDTHVEDCRELLKHFEDVLVVFVNRSANSVAHELTKAAYSMSGPQEWLYAAPEFIICNLALEAI
ncbi:uncharacterized protein LOC108212100 [Daucus carota subsp. sativus]|uniref:uncharacterized protein LOC108212100 n=1 Tax=Daucus carota subsp. sativus TaxID=79200 RepID=UPI0007EF4E6C|nr:PREDICTED: uncharacterized protein LOC108212100 [Daucus carota subsp. sativus]